MGKKLSDLVIMSDIDGTLLDSSGNLPKRNIAALERFTAAGGRFAVATGRSLIVARPIVKALPVNFPCVVYNGGATYDYGRRKYIDRIFLPQGAEKHFAKIWEAFPDCGAVLAGEHYIDVEGSTKRKQSWWLNQYPESHVRPAKLSEITQPAYKALLVLPVQRSQLLYEYLTEHAADFEGVRFVFSGATMFEMLPEGSSKGSAIERLLVHTGVKRENIVAAGDYYNDLEMFALAGLSAAPSSAQEEVKAAADVILGSCDEGAVADLVEHLEERYGD